MAKKNPKHPLLQEWASDYSALESKIIVKVAKLSDKQVTSLRRVTDALDQGNCWWATYRIKPLVQFAIEERGRMKRSKKRHSAASSPQEKK